MEVSAFSPGHITGFFQICDGPLDLLQKGSRGAGVSISKGTHTTVRLEPSTRNSFQVRINGHPAAFAVVSERVVRMILSTARVNYRITVEHRVEVPIGVGMGTSGAGALSLALALNEALDLNLSREEVAQVAHVAEVECRTGLGTVIAETYGGMEIRVKPGAPGVGKIVKIPLRGEYVVVCLPFSPISTRSVLSNESFRKRINELGGKFVEELVSRPRPEEFMRISRSFTEHVGLITERVKKVMKTADEAELPCGMPMFGEAVFSLLRREQAEELLEIFKRHRPTITNSSRTGDGFHNVVLAEVDEKGVRLV